MIVTKLFRLCLCLVFYVIEVVKVKLLKRRKVVTLKYFYYYTVFCRSIATTSDFSDFVSLQVQPKFFSCTENQKVS